MQFRHLPDCTSRNALGVQFMPGIGFVEVMENLESHGILRFHFPGLESPEI